MHIVRRSRLPLTPAAEYLCDLLPRAGLQQVPNHGNLSKALRPSRLRKSLRGKRA